MYIRDMTVGGFDDSLPNVVWVGWLGNKVNRRGIVPSPLMQLLRYHRAHFYVEDHLLGNHTCEICGQREFHGQFVIHAGKVHYLLPDAIFHYIEEHGYCPPYKFLKAIAPPDTVVERPQGHWLEIILDALIFLKRLGFFPVKWVVSSYRRRPKKFKAAYVGMKRRK